MVYSFCLFVVELGGRHIQGDKYLFAGRIASLGDGFHDQIECFLIATQVGGKSTFIAHGRIEFSRAQHFLQMMENLDAGPEGIAETVEAERHDHEFLDINGIVSMLPAIDDIHHRRRQRCVHPCHPDSDTVAVGSSWLRPWRRPARRPGWHWLPSVPCWESHRV